MAGSKADICPVCGLPLFCVTYGETAREEIRRFSREAVGWMKNPKALGGWMSSGTCCPKG